MDRLLNGGWSDAMLPVVSLLYRSPSFCLRDCFFHGFCHIICIHDHMAFAVPGSTADSLYQGCFRTKEAFLICIQDRYQRDLRNIQSFSQKVDPD